MASLQTRLCLLFDLTQVFIVSIKARNGLLDHADYCERRLKKQLKPIVCHLTKILNLQYPKNETIEFYALYQDFYRLWNQFFSDYQQRWTVCIINDDDDQWKMVHGHFKEFLKSVEYLSYTMHDI